MTFIQVYPAIDMKGGKCVRLYQGDYEQETIYGDSPFDMAKKFADEGATWIHLVDLDGAKDGEKIHANEVIRIAKELPVSVQIGGGIRSKEDVSFYLTNGVTRVIIGSLAIAKPELVVELLEEFGGDRIVIGLDAKDGMVATHGWLETSSQSAIEVGQYFASKGAKHVIFTDIATDGTLQGTNLKANKELAQATGLSVIVSGGISSLEDLGEVAKLAKDTTVRGVITGKALYNNRFTLTEALQEVTKW
ncbi:1-(5-phosphoribosyl)-5-[(5-phosphoribosylamino)methylideneamino]imidazole-4-carboxamide isomerase [Psychrobacillus lasiicapitis]|uniref:1-(5-phosphoribosyl)-5-[(5-phosphoribosylamino)methylideneamino] imidazole-4-carboxamide isomerase n=1 Tax=Psychrobacillus lasiicapitis TaxID=1636719 RepID=A0A544SZP1_9BACI|nr:1-(5-phosphoribosyl)-5-[(5-phosphoribosylamino)methylideneamino]imidazole-4-carboxamide isomerase [Psychrobacillus lasiicapitis]TQR10657.1 1-(5-phosphoribosyl)-5-[(5-phosphoribosylamino)methylideneamino]imidazole-4-carboxamide isomerase [Psychrobacillus lasiicapitis]GGA43698.1 1-(5-phosphoribosyl)-5-[(5-phosphoribosylamino) methylideneamino] imidazole-4-carboxamide isomerase [Psychrobacillus lasiicapitis]